MTIGPFTLDLHARRLSRGGKPVQLPSRSVDALAYLVTHRDRAVDKDEIIAAVWHDVAVTDDSLIHAISVIRRALGDDPAHPSFIETIPRRGYRFLGPVEEVEQAAGAPAAIGTEPVAPVPIERRPGIFVSWSRRRAIAIAGLAVTVAAFGVLRGGVTTEELGASAVARTQQVAPTGTAIVSGGVVSPTGRHLSFVARDESSGRTALWVRALDAPEPKMLAGTEGASKPFFSPDGRLIAFFANGQLGATDVNGGRTRTIASVHGAPAGGSWGANDTIVFAEWMTGLYSVPAAGGVVSRLTRLDHTALDVAHAWPQFLPDGRRFLYQVVSQDRTRTGVYVGSLDSPDGVRLLDKASSATYVAPGFLVYVQDGMLLAEPFDIARLRRGGRPVLLADRVAGPSLTEGNALSASREILVFRAGATEQQLIWVDRAGAPRGALDVPTPMFNVRVSPSGQHVLAASSLTDATGVWLVDLARRHTTQVAADGIAPLWSPDGRQLAFTSRGGLDLHVRPSTGGGRPDPVVTDQSVKILNDWSPEGQTIIYTRHDADTKLDLWHVPLSGGAARPLLKTLFNEAQARISPDGRWLAYVSDASGSPDVYVSPYPQLDRPQQVSRGGGGQPQWRADQQELFYLALDRSLTAVSVTGTGELSFGAPRRLFRTASADAPHGARESYAAMPDGRSFLIDARRDDVSTPITVMRHWAAGLAPAPAASTPSYIHESASR